MSRNYTKIMNRLFVSLAVLALFVPPAIAAQSWADEEVRRASKRGDVIPLAQIINQLKREHGCCYLDGELIFKSGDKAEYHISWEKNGRKILFIVDAVTGNVIRTSGG